MGIIINNTVISNLASIDRLDLLEKLFGKVYVSSKVYNEIIEGIKYGYNFQLKAKQIIDENRWLLVTGIETPEIDLYIELCKFLHEGEASCLSIAKNREWLFLTDDRDARDFAEESKIALSGTIGVLRDSVRMKFITLDAGEKYHEVLKKRGFRSPVKRLKDAL